MSAAGLGGLGALAAEQRHAHQKRSATAAARAALVGWQLMEIEGDGGPELVATRGATTRRFADLASAERWLDLGASA